MACNVPEPLNSNVSSSESKIIPEAPAPSVWIVKSVPLKNKPASPPAPKTKAPTAVKEAASETIFKKPDVFNPSPELVVTNSNNPVLPEASKLKAEATLSCKSQSTAVPVDVISPDKVTPVAIIALLELITSVPPIKSLPKLAAFEPPLKPSACWEVKNAIFSSQITV